MKNEKFTCSLCRKEKEVNQNGGTGYGTNDQGQKICYSCIGRQDQTEIANAKPGQKFVHYLIKENGHFVVSNWPGTWKANPFRVSIGRHNMAGKRYDVYIAYNGRKFHGVTYGDQTQICRIKCLSK